MKLTTEDEKKLTGLLNEDLDLTKHVLSLTKEDFLKNKDNNIKKHERNKKELMDIIGKIFPND